MRITVYDGRREIARAEVPLRDHRDDSEVYAAAKKICRAARTWCPEPARIRVEEPRGRDRFRFVREVIV